ncbi:Uncharacterised protein [Streptococcus pneumoniae]|nr:Uncharacterised protein [Streptococcus pneumoniae]
MWTTYLPKRNKSHSIRGMWYRELIFPMTLSYREDCFHIRIPSLFVLAVRIFMNSQSTVQCARFITINATVTDVKRLTKGLSAITETLLQPIPRLLFQSQRAVMLTIKKKWKEEKFEAEAKVLKTTFHRQRYFGIA